MDKRQKVLHRIEGLILTCLAQKCSLRYAANTLEEIASDIKALDVVEEVSVATETPLPPPPRHSQKGSDPAYPAHLPFSDTNTGYAADFAFFGGVTQRDYFAAHAPITLADALIAYGGVADPNNDSQRAALFAVWALLRWELADSMIAERERRAG